MLKEIRLYGKLAKFIGQRVLHADVATAAEAVRFLLANWPEVEQHMAENYYKVCVGNAALDENEVVLPIGQEVIKIIPVVAGAKNFFQTAFGKILAGIGLIALAFFAPIIVGALAASMSASVLATVVAILPSITTALYGIGIATVLGGVASLLTPVPKMGAGRGGDDSDPRKSYSFSGIQNTSRQGTPCPIVFGEVIVGSVVVSAGIDVVQVAA
jgi:predicted phage tail protein